MNPYLIQTRERPLRKAWIVPNDVDIELVLRIVERSLNSWAGRYFPIISLNSESLIDAQDWNLLQVYDPDIIVSFCQLGNDILRRIERKLSPLEIICPKPGTKNEDLIHTDSHLQPVSVPIPITDDAWRTLTGLRQKEAKLVQFESYNCNDKVMKLFIKLSFGSISDIRNPYYEDFFNQHTIYIDKCDTKTVSDSLSNQTRSWNFIYPIELSSIDEPRILNQSQLGRMSFLRIVIGDSMSDILWYWNQPLYTESSGTLNQVYLPKKLIEREELLVGFREWILGRSRRSNHQNWLDITSVSLTSEELKLLSDKFTPNEIIHYRRFQKAELIAPISKPNFYSLSLSESKSIFKSNSYLRLSSHQSVANESLIPIGETEWFQTLSPSYRMIDVFIEYQTPTLSHYWGNTKYWQLPKREYLPFDMFNKRGRVDNYGIPSILVANERELLKVELPSESSLFFGIITRYNERFEVDVLRKPFRPISYDHLALSAMGRYMNGILRLFDNDLNNCGDTIENPFWNHIFTRLAGEKSDKRNEIARELTLEQITNEAKIELNIYLDANPTDRDEIDKFKKDHPERSDYPFDEYKIDDRIHDNIEDFVKQGVLLPGIVLHCKDCGLRNWKIIDEVFRKFQCSGCTREQSMRGDEKIHFRINHLLGEGIIAYGLVPVIRALNQLRNEHRNSFIFIESSDIFEGLDKQPLTDLDVICLVDGRLHIGEVKESWTKFNAKELRKLLSVALRIRPDVFVIASEGNPKDDILKKINDELKPHLLKEEIELKTIYLPVIKRGTDAHFF